MAHVLARLRVRNFSTWKRGYDAHQPERRKATLRQKALFRSLTNPKEVFILFRAGNLKKAKAFMSSPNLRKVMKKNGVVGKPERIFLK